MENIAANFGGMDFVITVLDENELYCIVYPHDAEGDAAVQILKVVDESGSYELVANFTTPMKRGEEKMWASAMTVGMIFAHKSIEIGAKDERY